MSCSLAIQLSQAWEAVLLIVCSHHFDPNHFPHLPSHIDPKNPHTTKHMCVVNRSHAQPLRHVRTNILQRSDKSEQVREPLFHGDRPNKCHPRDGRPMFVCFPFLPISPRPSPVSSTSASLGTGHSSSLSCIRSGSEWYDGDNDAGSRVCHSWRRQSHVLCQDNEVHPRFISLSIIHPSASMRHLCCNRLCGCNGRELKTETYAPTTQARQVHGILSDRI